MAPGPYDEPDGASYKPVEPGPLALGGGDGGPGAGVGEEPEAWAPNSPPPVIPYPLRLGGGEAGAGGADDGALYKPVLVAGVEVGVEDANAEEDVCGVEAAAGVGAAGVEPPRRSDSASRWVISAKAVESLALLISSSSTLGVGVRGFGCWGVAGGGVLDVGCWALGFGRWVSRRRINAYLG